MKGIAKIKTNTKIPKQSCKNPVENIPAKIFKRLGAILSRVIKMGNRVGAMDERQKKLDKKITSLAKEIADYKKRITK